MNARPIQTSFIETVRADPWKAASDDFIVGALAFFIGPILGCCLMTRSTAVAIYALAVKARRRYRSICLDSPNP